MPFSPWVLPGAEIGKIHVGVTCAIVMSPPLCDEAFDELLLVPPEQDASKNAALMAATAFAAHRRDRIIFPPLALRMQIFCTTNAAQYNVVHFTLYFVGESL